MLWAYHNLVTSGINKFIVKNTKKKLVNILSAEFHKVTTKNIETSKILGRIGLLAKRSVQAIFNQNAKAKGDIDIFPFSGSLSSASASESMVWHILRFCWLKFYSCYFELDVVFFFLFPVTNPFSNKWQ